MRKLLVCQHVAFEILGTLDPLLRGSGFRIKYVNFSRYPDAVPNLDGYHGLVLLGGPMSVYQTEEYPHLVTEMHLVRQAMAHNMPVLGICLGAQIIARALDCEVRANREKEIGWYDVTVTDEGRDDPLFSNFALSERIFQWHGDTFDLPPAAVHLARTTTCENQAFRIGNNVYGLQFHLEVDERLIARWLRVPIHVAELEQLKGKIDPAQIRHETPEYIDRLKHLSDRTFGSFVRLFGDRRRVAHLASR